MKRVARKIFYIGLFRFQLFLLAITILPLLAIKLVIHYYPSNLEEIVNILILAGFCLMTVGSCIYVLIYYSSLDRTLKPITRMAEVGELAARVAHDLRGPLAGIQTVLQLLPDRRDQNDLEPLNLLELSYKRLEKVASDLLKKHTGKEEEPVLFDLHEVLDELIGEYHAQPVLNGVSFVKQYASHPIFVNGRRNRIERVFGNIIKNAVEAMELEGAMVLRTKMADFQAHIEIHDSGPGLSQEKIAKIMRGPFTEGKEGGYGLGLVFVKEVLAEHGGRLRIDSRPNEGCCFRITFSAAQQKPPAFVLKVRKNKPILVIDDEPVFLEQWRTQLGQKGLSMVGALSYEDFLAQAIRVENYPTAIIDYHFDNSEVDGLTMVKKIMARGWKEIYLCSAEYWKPSLKKAAHEFGVPIIPKPLPEIVIVNPAKEDGYQVLVIDDEDSIRLAWEVIQDKLHIEKLYSFPNLETLQSQAIDFQTIDIAFVDKNIQNSQFSGAEAAAYLKSKGVAKVVLASGENEAALRRDPAFAEVDFISTDKIPTSFRPFFS